MNDPDDERGMLRCIKSTEMAAALFEIVNNAHRHTESVDEYRERILAACSKVNLDELIN